MIARFLDDDTLLAAVERGGGGPWGGFEPVDARNLGGTWVLDQLWSRLGIDTAIRQVAKRRKVDPERVERVLFALVAGRALASSSKLEATRWVRREVHIDGLVEADHKTCYRAMDFQLDALDELQQTVFFTVADLLQLDVDLLFFDTTSAYFQVEFAVGELDDDGDDGADSGGFRVRGHSKDPRPDLPQVVIGMALTRGGVPVRLWVWPRNTPDTSVLEQVRSDLAGWRLNRTVWVTDAGFNSADNCRLLQAGGSGLLRINRSKVAAAAKLDGKFLLRCSDPNLDAGEVAAATRPWPMWSGAGGISSSWTCGRSTTDLNTASSATSSCAGCRCCSSAPPSSSCATGGETSPKNCSGSGW